MGEELTKYLNGNQNAVRDEFIISREKCGGSEFVHVHHPDIPEPLYEFWTSRKKHAGGKPKHTGGKKPYVMLMIEELTSLICQGVPAESVGYLICLAPYIEWGTGNLLCGRSKRKMLVSDIEKVFKKSRRMTLYIMANLKSYNLLAYTKEGYFISRNLIKRGAFKSEDKV